MKKTIITTLALVCATMCASAQNTNPQPPNEVKNYEQFSIGSNALLNSEVGGAYTFNAFTRLDKDSTPTKGIYFKIGASIPANRFIFYGALGLSFPASKTNVNKFIDVGLVYLSDFKDKKQSEMFNLFGIESAYRWDNLTKAKILNIRLGLVAGYHNYVTLPVGAPVNDNSKAGFRIMPTLGVSINLYSKSRIIPIKKR